MSDWEVVADLPQQKSKPVQSDWEVVPYKSKEESFLKKLPRNIAIGLTHAGRNLHNLPHDIAHGIDVGGSAIGRFLGAPELQKQNSNIASYLPNDVQNYADVFGQKGEGTPVDNLIQKGFEYGPDIIAGAGALRDIGLLPHLTRRGASRSLRNARQMAQGRNIRPLDIDPNLIEDAAQFLPRTAPYRNALEAASHGDYDALFRLQSDLGKHSSDYSRSLFSASERAHGRAGAATRNSLLDQIHHGLQSQGHHDISDLLRRGQNEYRRYARFKPYRNALGIAAGASMLPKNALIDLVKKLATTNRD